MMNESSPGASGLAEPCPDAADFLVWFALSIAATQPGQGVLFRVEFYDDPLALAVTGPALTRVFRASLRRDGGVDVAWLPWRGWRWVKVATSSPGARPQVAFEGERCRELLAHGISELSRRLGGPRGAVLEGAPCSR